jgi:TRAP-type transport system small permease protein
MTQKRASILTSMTERMFARLILVQKRLCGLLIVVMVLLIIAEVVCRNVFNFSLQITHEVAGYLLVAVTFLGIGVSLHDRALFRVEFLFSRLPARGQHILQLVFDLLALGFGVILDYQLVRLVVSSYTRGVREATILATPLYIPQIVMPVGVSLMIVVLLAHIWGDLRALYGLNGAGRPRTQPR